MLIVLMDDVMLIRYVYQVWDQQKQVIQRQQVYRTKKMHVVLTPIVLIEYDEYVIWMLILDIVVII